MASWEVDSLFAGTSQAVVAEDAWYLYGLQLENAKLRGDHTTGGSTDIFKCSDQIQREFLTELCRLGGFSPGHFVPTAPSLLTAATTIPLLGGWGCSLPPLRHPAGLPT